MPGRFGFPAAARSNHDDIDDWLDALGDELAREFPDLIDEPPSHTGNPFGEQGANERGATVREPGPDFTKKRWSPGECAVWLFVVGCVIAKIVFSVVRG